MKEMMNMTNKEIVDELFSNLTISKEEMEYMNSEEGKTKFKTMNALAVFHRLVELTKDNDDVDEYGIETIRNILYAHALKKNVIEWDEEDGLVLCDTREKVETLNI